LFLCQVDSEFISIVLVKQFLFLLDLFFLHPNSFFFINLHWKHTIFPKKNRVSIFIMKGTGFQTKFIFKICVIIKYIIFRKNGESFSKNERK
jgi:hypothetical protein